MLKRCAEPGCETFVLGGFCLDHELPQTRVFVRGRPFVPAVATSSTAVARGQASAEARQAFARAGSPALVGVQAREPRVPVAT